MIEEQTSLDTQTYYNLGLGELSLSDVISQIKTFLEEDEAAEYSLIIGSDSQERPSSDTSTRLINLITAIVVHRKGFGARYFWLRKKDIPVHSLREKIYVETLTSLQFASEFVPKLKKTLNGHAPKYLLEIHVDIGEHGETREMIKEITGMVTGNGFVAKTKPYAFGASYVADKHT